MTTRQQNRPEYQRLMALTEAFGGDPARWPPAARDEVANLIATDDTAKSIVSQARAFDRVLDRSPAPSLQPNAALVQRIVTAAVTEGRPFSSEAATAQSTGMQTERPIYPGVRAAKSPAPYARRIAVSTTPLRSAALMAASLLMGIYAGATLLPADMPVSSVSLAENSDDGMIQQLVLGDDNLDSIDEDLL